MFLAIALTLAAADPVPAAVTVTGAAGTGSGTVVWAGAGKSLVLTNRHVVAGGGSATVGHGSAAHPGSVVAVGTADAALVEVGAELPAAPLAESAPAPGDVVVMWSHSRRQLKRGVWGRCGWRCSTILSSPGDSGAGVFDARGRLVALNCGGDGVTGQYGVELAELRAFVAPRLRRAVPRAAVTVVRHDTVGSCPAGRACLAGSCPCSGDGNCGRDECGVGGRSAGVVVVRHTGGANVRPPAARCETVVPAKAAEPAVIEEGTQPNGLPYAVVGPVPDVGYLTSTPVGPQPPGMRWQEVPGVGWRWVGYATDPATGRPVQYEREPDDSAAPSRPAARPVASARPTSSAGYVTGQGHTHTCPSCRTTWDHGAVPGHNCPKCGTAQYVQDSPALRLALPQSGGCANGQCQTAAPVRAGILRR